MKLQLQPIEITLTLTHFEAKVLHALTGSHIIGDATPSRKVTTDLWERLNDLAIFGDAGDDADHFEGYLKTKTK